MDTAATSLHALLAPQLRESWQAKVLCGSTGKLHAVVESVIAHNFDEAFPFILRAIDAFPPHPPGLCSAGKIAKTGHVCADVIRKNGERINMQAFFTSKMEMEGEFRRLADAARLSDRERTEMFQALQNWVVCDYRLDPNMDPRDPDAARLTS